MRPIRLAPSVTLPKAAMIDAPHLQMALGVSRALICLWRRERAFPVGHREGKQSWTFTNDVQRWCEGYRCKVIRL